MKVYFNVITFYYTNFFNTSYYYYFKSFKVQGFIVKFYFLGYTYYESLMPYIATCSQ